MIFDIVLTLLARAFKALANIVVIALVARLLGREDLGGYFYSFSIANPLSFLMPLGAGVAVIRFVAHDNSFKSSRTPFQVIFSANIGVTILSLIVGGVAYFIFFLSGAKILSALQMVQTCVVGIVMGLLALQSDCFRSIGRFKESSFYSNSLPSILALVFFGICWVAGLTINLDIVLWITIAGSAFALVVSSFVMFKAVGGSWSLINFSDVFKESLALFKVGSGNLAGSALGVFLPSIALVLCGQYFGSSEAAELGLAQRVLFFVTLPLWIASTVLPPKISKLFYENNFLDLKKLLNLFSAAIGTVSIGIAALISMFSHELLLVVAGSEFPLAEKILQVLVWASAFYGVFGVCISVVMVSSSNRSLFLSLPLSLAVFYAAAFLLKDVVGVLGIAIAQSLAMLAHSAFSLYVLYRITNILVFPDFPLACRVFISRVFRR